MCTGQTIIPKIKLMETVEKYVDIITEMLIKYTPKVLFALVLLWIGFRVINRLVDTGLKAMERSGISQDVRPFLASLMGLLLKALLVFSAAGIVGIETTSFVAALAAAGFAVGLALQGSLGNFAAGIIILIFKPYKAGDLVSIGDNTGHVAEVQIFNTVLATLDNKTVIVPNSEAINGAITNLSTRQILRVDLEVPMPYAEDFDRIEAVLLEALRQTPKVLQDPAPFVGIQKFDSHSIILDVRPYADAEDFWDVYYAANRNIKRALSEHGIPVASSEGVYMGTIGK